MMDPFHGLLPLSGEEEERQETLPLDHQGARIALSYLHLKAIFISFFMKLILLFFFLLYVFAYISLCFMSLKLNLSQDLFKC